MATKSKPVEAKRPKIYFDVDPMLRNRFKAAAALQGKTLREWATEALIEKLEDEIDAREGLAALNEPGENIPWEQVKAGLLAKGKLAV